jgi:hypothetical protein
LCRPLLKISGGRSDATTTVMDNIYGHPEGNPNCYNVPSRITYYLWVLKVIVFLKKKTLKSRPLNCIV